MLGKCLINQVQKLLSQLGQCHLFAINPNGITFGPNPRRNKAYAKKFFRKLLKGQQSPAMAFTLLVSEQLEARRCIMGYEYPECKSRQLSKNGHRRGRQAYICLVLAIWTITNIIFPFAYEDLLAMRAV